jgi:hypothetical protein
MSQDLIPEIGSLAWSPHAAVDAIEILDRFNGVPTLGIIRANAGSHLFWRVAPYVSDVSIWLYVPVGPTDLVCLESTDDDPLDRLVFRSVIARHTTMAVAHDNRVVFEREWRLPEELEPPQLLRALMGFAAEALRIALLHDPLPASRRHIVRHASLVVRDLLPN